MREAFLKPKVQFSPNNMCKLKEMRQRIHILWVFKQGVYQL